MEFIVSDNARSMSFGTFIGYRTNSLTIKGEEKGRKGRSLGVWMKRTDGKDRLEQSLGL
jgi:hypothetical protein